MLLLPLRSQDDSSKLCKMPCCSQPASSPSWFVVCGGSFNFTRAPLDFRGPLLFQMGFVQGSFSRASVWANAFGLSGLCGLTLGPTPASPLTRVPPAPLLICHPSLDAWPWFKTEAPASIGWEPWPSDADSTIQNSDIKKIVEAASAIIILFYCFGYSSQEKMEDISTIIQFFQIFWVFKSRESGGRHSHYHTFSIALGAHIKRK